MKKFISLILFGLAAFLLFFSCTRQNSRDEYLVIYSYDSFVSDWGPGPKVIPLFESKYGIKTRIVSAGDSGQLLSRLIFEKDNPSADIVIGIDNNMLHRALASDVLEPYKSPEIANIDQSLVFDTTYHVTPFDYGFFTIIYDSHRIENPPQKLTDLLKPEYQKSIILMDPRTSGPGLGFLMWTVKIFGNSFPDFWQDLQPNILTVTDGWSSGYGLFVSGEAPMVLSYTTSPAYHLEYENTDRYKAVIFENGNYMHIEGAGIVKGTSRRKEAELFMDFVLSEDFQREIPLTNWMFPVTDVELPESFSIALKPDKQLLMDSVYAAENIESWIGKWLEAAVK